MALKPQTARALQVLLNLLLTDDAACEGVVSAARRRCHPAAQELVFTLVAKGKPSQAHGSLCPTALDTIGDALTYLEAQSRTPATDAPAES